MTLLKELKQRKKITSKLNGNDVDPSLAKMYDWVIHQDRLEKYLDELIPVLDKLDTSSYNSPGASNLKEQAALGLQLISNCTENTESRFYGTGFWSAINKYNLVDRLNVRHDHRLPKIRDKYLIPFWNYLIQKIERENENYTVESKIEYKIESVFEDEFQESYPKTFDLIEITNESLNHDQNTWNGVANSCRDILVQFGKELLQNSSIGNEEIKKGNTKRIVRSVLKEDLPSSRFNNTVVKLFESTWNHASSALHRPNLKKDEVVRIFVWVTLTLSEIATFEK